MRTPFASAAMLTRLAIVCWTSLASRPSTWRRAWMRTRGWFQAVTVTRPFTLSSTRRAPGRMSMVRSSVSSSVEAPAVAAARNSARAKSRRVMAGLRFRTSTEACREGLLERPLAGELAVVDDRVGVERQVLPRRSPRRLVELTVCAGADDPVRLFRRLDAVRMAPGVVRRQGHDVDRLHEREKSAHVLHIRIAVVVGGVGLDGGLDRAHVVVGPAGALGVGRLVRGGGEKKGGGDEFHDRLLSVY